MSIQQMQQDLIRQITAVDDKDILRMLDEELSYSLQSKDDISSLLSDEDLKELTMLANEPIDKSTMSLKEFNSVMNQWSMRS